MLRFFGILLVALIAIAGCKPPPDPNDPADVGVMDPEVLMRNLKTASIVVNERVAKKEITDEEGKDILAKYADKLTANIDVTKIIPQTAWKYGDVFRLARKWEEAQKLLTVAVEHAEKTKNEDRRVNDLLRLAQVEAKLDNYDKAFEFTRKTFTTPASGKAPILYGVLYELVPAAQGNKRDADLAELLEEAIAQHNEVIVDPQTESGVTFLSAKGYHEARAWTKVIELYRAAGKDDLAKQAQEKAAGTMTNQQRL
ncbi:MAG: hypothetical protein KF784_11965 [Fimbriimonadaceae bacterium]|nr:hypothetical protein [Fimbriimonadaceae bacterium]